jgi:hypothetical protein
MDVAPKELGELLRNAIYKHSAPMASRNGESASGVCPILLISGLPLLDFTANKS